MSKQTIDFVTAALDAMQRHAEKLHAAVKDNPELTRSAEEIMEGIHTFKEVMPKMSEYFDNYVWLLGGHTAAEIDAADATDIDPPAVVQDQVIAYLANAYFTLGAADQLISRARKGE